MSDKNGKLLFYSNGCEIHSYKHKLLKNGDNINPGHYHDGYCEGSYSYYPGYQSMITLPMPKHDSLFYLFSEAFDENIPKKTKLYYNVINSKGDNGAGEVIDKNHLIAYKPSNQDITDGMLSDGMVTACKHGNGRDWWVLVPKLFGDMFFRTLLTDKGVVSLDSQAIGIKSVYPDFAGQSVFSPDGRFYIRSDHFTGTYIYDFDRCTGLLSNLRHITYPLDTMSAAGAAVSSNSRFLYVTTVRKLYQFDLLADDIAASQTFISRYDDKFTTGVLGYPGNLYYSSLAPDNKIYITSNSQHQHWGIINQPDLKGTACDFKNHALELKSLNYKGMPNFPHFRLGPLKGSPCDSLITAAAELDKEESAVRLVYSNSSGAFQLESKVGNAEARYQVHFFDLAGRSVLTLGCSEGQSYLLGALASGAYPYRIEQDGKQVGIGKVVVVR
ncbi:MAG: hypothetical protein RLZZ292_1437 [Bacteroidota bacterium]|jgi:hypothetical protein